MLSFEQLSPIGSMNQHGPLSIALAARAAVAVPVAVVVPVAPVVFLLAVPAAVAVAVACRWVASYWQWWRLAEAAVSCVSTQATLWRRSISQILRRQRSSGIGRDERVIVVVVVSVCVCVQRSTLVLAKPRATLPYLVVLPPCKMPQGPHLHHHPARRTTVSLRFGLADDVSRWFVHLSVHGVAKAMRYWYTR